MLSVSINYYILYKRRDNPTSMNKLRTVIERNPESSEFVPPFPERWIPYRHVHNTPEILCCCCTNYKYCISVQNVTVLSQQPNLFIYVRDGVVTALTEKSYVLGWDCI